MPSGRLLRKLIKSGAEGNTEVFRELSQQVIDEERQRQHHLLANDLEHILYGQHKAGHLQQPQIKVPEDRSNGVPLLWLSTATRDLDDLVLGEEQQDALQRLLEQYDRVDVLQAYGLRPDCKLLFYGPPGTGKTVTAEAIAFRLERPLAIVRLDSLVSSYLGETASNLQRVFEFIDRNELVVLFDEFDAIARERNSTDDHGELKRVVNAVLQMLDRFAGRSLVIAATNHEQTLDYAIWRRFDDVCYFMLPNPQQSAAFLALRLRGLRLAFDLFDLPLETLTAGWSYADLQRAAEQMYKRTVLRGLEFLEKAAAERILRREMMRIERTQ